MSHAMDDHEMVLRNVLRAAAEQLEPAVDGLERIKAQLGPPLPVPLAWVCAMWTRLCLRAPDGLWTVTDRIAREFRVASERFMPAAGSRGSGRRHDRLSWLRPAAAMSIVVFIVTAVVYMAIEVPQVISPGSFNTNQAPGGHPSSQGSGNGSRNTQTEPGVGPFGSKGSGKSGGAHPPACSATPRATKLPTITPSASPSASTSPSQTSSPTPTPTSASPTPTSPSPSGTSSSPASGTGTGGTSGASSSPSAGAAASTAPGAAPPAGGTVMKTSARSDSVAHPMATPCASPGPSKKTKPPTISLGAVSLLPPALTSLPAGSERFAARL
jgi:hypothetical protein